MFGRLLLAAIFGQGVFEFAYIVETEELALAPTAPELLMTPCIILPNRPFSRA